MPTTRHQTTQGGRLNPAVILPEQIPATFVGDSTEWSPRHDEQQQPFEYGVELFAHGTHPDGTRLTPEERRYIAAVVLQEWKG